MLNKTCLVIRYVSYFELKDIRTLSNHRLVMEEEEECQASRKVLLQVRKTPASPDRPGSVGFPVRAQAWVAGQVSGLGRESQPFDGSLPFFPPPSPSL